MNRSTRSIPGTWDPDKPVFVVPIGPPCNNRCEFCMERSRGSRSRLDLEQIREQMAQMRDLTDVVILSNGEPTLSRFLLQAVAAAREFGFREITLSTNGRRLQERDFARNLLEAGLNDLRVGLHGPEASIHDAVTRRRGSFSQTVTGLRNLAELRSDFQFRLMINCTIVIRNLDFMREIAEFALTEGADAVNFNVVEARGAAADNLATVVPVVSL